MPYACRKPMRLQESQRAFVHLRAEKVSGKLNVFTLFILHRQPERAIGGEIQTCGSFAGQHPWWRKLGQALIFFPTAICVLPLNDKRQRVLDIFLRYINSELLSLQSR